MFSSNYPYDITVQRMDTTLIGIQKPVVEFMKSGKKIDQENRYSYQSRFPVCRKERPLCKLFSDRQKNDTQTNKKLNNGMIRHFRINYQIVEQRHADGQQRPEQFCRTKKHNNGSGRGSDHLPGGEMFGKTIVYHKRHRQQMQEQVAIGICR